MPIHIVFTRHLLAADLLLLRGGRQRKEVEEFIISNSWILYIYKQNLLTMHYFAGSIKTTALIIQAKSCYNALLQSSL